MKTNAFSTLEDINTELHQEFTEALQLNIQNIGKESPGEFIKDMTTKAMWRVAMMHKRAVETEETLELEKNNVLLLKEEIKLLKQK